MTFKLRDYQKRLGSCLQRETAQRRPGDRLLVSIATGGGKTCVLNELLRVVVARGDRALIVTKDWLLLSQAAQDFTGRCGAEGLIGYLGSGPEARKLFEGVPRTVDQPVVYTTIHSWFHRSDKEFATQDFDYVFIDELHWGEAGVLYQKLMERYKDKATFIGFTATPRNWTKFRLVDRAYDFAELLNRQILARPVVVDSRSTGVSWTPVLSNEHGDITQSSLNELAANESRNNLIVKTYCDEAEKWGKTLVFACNIDHAEVLAGKFENHRVKVGVIHHKIPAEEKQRIRDGFRSGELDVLVNVTMFTHGVDIPEIKTIFLARPTTSDILFSQMIGRGSRRCDGKDSFYVLDFVDAVQKHGIPIVRPEGFFGSVALTRKSRNPPINKHRYKACPLTTFPSLPGYEPLWGLDIQPEQTFGLEFEIAPKDGSTYVGHGERQRVATAIGLAIQHLAPFETAYDYTCWRLKTDSSCGLELVTRILQGPEGYMEVYDVMTTIRPILDAMGYTVSEKTGFHAHHGCSGVHFTTLKRFISFIAYYEPALYSLVDTSRVGNKYTTSMRLFYKKLRLQPAAAWRDTAQHYDGVSLHPFWDRRGTYEVRMQKGTLDPVIALTWVSLFQRMFAKSLKSSAYCGDASKKLYRSPWSPGPRGDILHLAEFVNASQNLKDRLVAWRKRLLLESWSKHPKWGKLARQLGRRWYPGLLPPEMVVVPRRSQAVPQMAVVG